jgi:hypothetical protein
MQKLTRTGQRICRIIASGLLSASAGPGQASSQALPPAAPTALAPSAAQSAARANSALPAHRAEVLFSGGLLTVHAQNSSMNQILGDIGRATGMKITGGITEERVFGTYGPGGPGEVLTRLLDGTGSNVLLREDRNHTVRELVLTARLGGVTPPPPAGLNGSNGGDGNNGNDEPPAPSERWRQLQARREAANARLQQQMQQQQNQPQENGSPGAGPVTQQPDQQQPQSPNGVRTPSQMDHPENPFPVFPVPDGNPPPN